MKFRLKNERIELRVTSLQCTCQLRLMTDRGDLMITKPTKTPKPKKRNPRRNRVNHCVLRSRSGCKNSEKILITADHKVLSDNCESRSNHRYAVVVQDLAAQWIQAYPCKTKTSQETQRSLQEFLEPDRNPKVIYTDNSLEFGKASEDLS